MSSAPNDPADQHGKLGLLDAISIIVGIVIGTTIYKVPGLIFLFTADPIWGLGVWVLGGLLAMIGAFCYAELATTYPRSGGDYYYLSKAFGPGTGFLFGWAQLTVVMPASIGVMAYVFADFFLQTFPEWRPEFELALGAQTVKFDPYFSIAAIVIVALTLTNCLGVFLGKWVQNLLSFAKIIGLGSIIVAGLGWGTPDAWEYTASTASASPYIGSLAMILVMYAYGGWNDSAFVAAEVRNPQRNIPRALFLGVGLIIAVYLLVNAAYINGVGWSNVAKVDNLPASTIQNSPLGEWGGKAINIIIMVSALGAVNGLTFTGARVYATLGSDHRLFGWMGYWRPNRGAPIMALLAQCVLTVFIVAVLTTERGHQLINDAIGHINQGLDAGNDLLADLGVNWSLSHIEVAPQWQAGDGFAKLVDRTAPVFWLFFLLTGLSLFILREKNKDTPRPYSVPFYPIVPLIFCNSCAWMLYQATKYVEWHALFAFALVLLGVPLYWFSRLISGSRPVGPVDIIVVPPHRLRPPARQ
jgi:APA family basic amino acid/polyamine antiporter